MSVVSKHIKPWYIWFSFLAFLILSIDTLRRCKFFNIIKGIDSKLIEAAINIFALFAIFVMLPFILFSIATNLALQAVVEGSAVHSITIYARIPMFYLSGVYATYRHFIWRTKNLSLSQDV